MRLLQNTREDEEGWRVADHEGTRVSPGAGVQLCVRPAGRGVGEGRTFAVLGRLSTSSIRGKQVTSTSPSTVQES